MAVIRQKKRNLIISAVIGFMAGIIPTGAILLIIAGKYISLDKEYRHIKEGYHKYTACMFNEEKARGDIIEKGDLKEVAFYSEEVISGVENAEAVGKVLRQDAENGMIITKSMVYEEAGIDDDLRMYMFDYIIVPDSLDKGTMFDIRISFPNGEDYIVAKGKTIESRTETEVFINATEKELLMISSAYVDTTIYEGAKVYASIYVTDYQELPVVNYPVNMYVTKLAGWNPNLIEEIEETQDIEKRQILEGNLYEFMGVAMTGTAK